MGFGKIIFAGASILQFFTGPAFAEGSLSIAVTTPPQAYFVEALLPPPVSILVVMPPNADHEHYEPGLAELKKLAEADAYVVLGHPRAAYEEEWVSRLRELRQKRSDLKIVNPAESLPLDPQDSHYWTSPQTAAKLVEALAAELAQAFPEHRAAVEARLPAALSAIRKLHDDIKEELRDARGCSFLVYHGAWRYFAADYGLNQLSFEEQGREPGLRRTAATLDAARQAGIRVLFLEPQQPPSSVRAVTEQLELRTEVLDPLARDWAANLKQVSERIKSACAERATGRRR